VVLGGFSFFMAFASFVGSYFPAVYIGRERALLAVHASSFEWNCFWIVLENATVAGAGLGLICGLFCTLLCAGLQMQDPRRSWNDRALGILGAPLFVLGAVNGVFIAILTTGWFRDAYIWNWWRAL